MTLIPQCSHCGPGTIEYIDAETGEFLPDWLVEARGIKRGDWHTELEPALLRWQGDEGYSDEEMQWGVDGLINSERVCDPKKPPYDSLTKALQRRVRMGYDKVNGQQNTGARYPAKTNRY